MRVGSPEYERIMEGARRLREERGATKPFEIGKSYQTNDGRTVTCIELSTTPGYECARFDDGEDSFYETGGWEKWCYEARDWVKTPVVRHPCTTGWRYNRDEDRGRSTGTAFDHSDPRCVIPEAL